MKWLTAIGNIARWILGIVPPVAAAPPPVPKQPLTEAELGWTQEKTVPTKPPPKVTP